MGSITSPLLLNQHLYSNSNITSFSYSFLPKTFSFHTSIFPTTKPPFFSTFKKAQTNSKNSNFGPIYSEKVTNVTKNRDFWEEPDDGSEYDEDESENDMDFESDWEEEEKEINGSVLVKEDYKSYVSRDVLDDEFTKEVEQLLEPEERAILLENVAPNLGKISTEKWSALHSLALAGQIPHLDMLLESRVNIDLVDKGGLTALHTAIMGKKEAVISHLLRKGASPHARDQDGASPLHYAVQVGAMQTVKLLIKYNVDLSAEDNEGWTPLHIAVQTRNRHITKILLVNGADKNRRNKKGKTPLDLALCYGKDFKSYDLAKLLKVLPADREY